MNLETMIKIKNNPINIKYLHENSNWYKILNRNPEMFDEFVKELKVNYKLRPIDKINNTITLIETLQNLIATIK